jgi:hypothetical protein
MTSLCDRNSAMPVSAVCFETFNCYLGQKEYRPYIGDMIEILVLLPDSPFGGK